MECICRPIKLRVLYLNARSINPRNRNHSFGKKIQQIKELINHYNPNIIAIVESWLKESHQDDDIVTLLGLQGYRIFRQDRGSTNRDNAYGDIGNHDSGRRGGGILVGFHCADVSIRFERSFAEDYADNIMNFNINNLFNCNACRAQNSPGQFGFTVVYRRPGPYRGQNSEDFNSINDEIIDRLAHLGYYYNDPLAGTDDVAGYNSFAMVGDFNWKGIDNHLEYIRGYQNIRLELSSPATHTGGQALDQVYSNREGFVQNDLVKVTEPISDHSALIFQLNLGNDNRSNQRCDYCYRRK